jgi:hypothetical protein
MSIREISLPKKSVAIFYSFYPKRNNPSSNTDDFNTLNAELYPICNLLALFGAHHILHISRIKVKNGNFR